MADSVVAGGGVAITDVARPMIPDDWPAHPAQRLVALGGDGRVFGWAASSEVCARSLHAGVVEHPVYVDPTASNRGPTPLTVRKMGRAAWQGR
jgi:L-amino acid N-acyltransferase YncA